MTGTSANATPYWAEARHALGRVDPILGNLIRAAGGSVLRPRNGVVTLLNDRAVNWHRTQAQAVAVAVCHRLIAWLRNWRNVFREIR